MNKTNEVMIYALSKGYHINNKGQVISPLGKIRKINFDHSGYPRFGISMNGKIKNVYLHKMAAYLKYGDKMFESGIQVRHKNGNKMDINNENILIGTGSDNSFDRPKEVRKKYAKFAAAHLRKFTMGEIMEIKKLNSHGIGIGRISKAYKVAKSTLSYILNNKTYVN